MRITLLLFLLVLPIRLISQNLSGIIYDADSRVQGARLYNETQNSIDFSDAEGQFSITVNVGDRLIIYSLFHDKIYITVTENLLKEPAVFELKKFTNQLDEVEVRKINQKTFDSTVLQNDLSIPVRAPKIPVLRSGSNYEPTLNLISLATAIGKLFKKKKIDVPTIKAEDFEKLFETDSFFTIDFLRKDLHIQDNETYLFFEYCANQNLAPALFDNQLLMVEALLECSANFRIAKEAPNKN